MDAYIAALKEYTDYVISFERNQREKERVAGPSPLP
jgi:hypothetical protein